MLLIYHYNLHNYSLSHNSKLMETYKFPVMHVENHKLTFKGPARTHTGAKKTAPEIHDTKYFTELSKQFNDIGNK